MDSDFQDKFIYLATFLAVVVGLAAFKEAASSHHLLIFGVEWSILTLSLPFLAGMLIATYLAALTLIVRRWNFTLLPLGKILEISSYSAAAASLFYVLLVPVTWMLSESASRLHAIHHATPIFLSLTVIEGAALLYAATRYAISKNNSLTDEYLAKVSETSNAPDTFLNGHPPNAQPLTLIFEKYESVLAKAKGYFRARGYGVSGGNLGRIAQMLLKKKVFDDKDVDLAKQATHLRNAYAHALKAPTREDAEALIAILNKLGVKLDEALYKLSLNGGDASDDE